MNVTEATVLVTGSNRGIGRALVEALAAAGARRIYATARDPSKAADLVKLDPARITSFELDITRPELVRAAAERCSDVDLLVNNAGVNFNTPLIAQDSIDNARREIEVNYLGTLTMCRAFAPILGANGGGMIVNLLSMLARVCLPAIGSLCASKGAGLLMTQGVRAELAAQGTRVLAVLPGPVDTDMTPGGESKPAEIAAAIVEAIREEPREVWLGPMAIATRDGLAADAEAVEREFASYLPG